MKVRNVRVTLQTVFKTSILSEPELFLQFGFDWQLYLNTITTFNGKEE